MYNTGTKRADSSESTQRSRKRRLSPTRKRKMQIKSLRSMVMEVNNMKSEKYGRSSGIVRDHEEKKSSLAPYSRIRGLRTVDDTVLALVEEVIDGHIKRRNGPLHVLDLRNWELSEDVAKILGQRLPSSCHTILFPCFFEKLKTADNCVYNILQHLHHNVRSLVLSRVPFTFDLLRKFKLARLGTKIQELSLEKCPRMNDKCLITICQSMSNLRKINVAYCQHITDQGAAAIGTLRGIQEVDLSYCSSIRGLSIQNLLEHCPSIRMFSCEGITHIDDDKLKFIVAEKVIYGYTQRKRYLPLRNLNLRSTMVTESGIIWLSTRLKWLTYLDVSMCNIRDAALNILGQNCDQLQHLDISYCKNVSNEGIISMICGDQRNVMLNSDEWIGLDSLQYFACSHCTELTGHAISILCKGNAETLRELRIDGIKMISADSLKAISKCEYLTHIDIGRIAHGSFDSGLKEVAKKILPCTPKKGHNLALGKVKQVEQSSTLGKRHATYAVDGNMEGYYGNDIDDPNGNVTHTSIERNPWWQIDVLPHERPLSLIKVWMCNDKFVGLANIPTSHLVPLWIMVSDKPFGRCSLKEARLQATCAQCFRDHKRVYTLNVYRKARYVRVQVEGANKALTIAQVQVFTMGTNELSLANTKIQHKTLRIIAQNFIDLATLNLSGIEQVDDKSLIFFSYNCRNLKNLDVSNCVKIQGKGIDAVTQKCENLNVLKINGCSNLTTKGVLFLKKAKNILELDTRGILSLQNAAGSFVILLILQSLSNLQTLRLDNTEHFRDMIRKYVRWMPFATPVFENMFITLSISGKLKNKRKRRDYLSAMKRLHFSARRIQDTFRSHLNWKQMQLNDENEKSGSFTVDDDNESVPQTDQNPKKEKKKKKRKKKKKKIPPIPTGMKLSDSKNAQKAIHWSSTNWNVSEAEKKTDLEPFMNNAMFTLHAHQFRKMRTLKQIQAWKKLRITKARHLQNWWRKITTRDLANLAQSQWRRMRRGITKTQALYRGAIARILVRKLRVRIAERYLKSMAVKDMIQSISPERRHIIEHACAIIIQRMCRVHRFNVLMNVKALFRRKRNKAATKIQSFVRIRLAKTAMRKLQNLVLKRVYFRAATKIIGFFRLKYHRSKYILNLAKRDRAATKIQSLWRIQIGRNELERRRICLRKRLAAILILQRHIRGRQAVSRFNMLMSMKQAAQTLKRHRNKCALMIQKAYRIYVAKRIYGLRLADLALKMHRQNEGAKKIQQFIRYVLSLERLKVQAKRVYQEHLRRRRASIRIQRWLRNGFLFRRRLKKSYYIRFIQRMVRKRLFRNWIYRKVRLQRLRHYEKKLERLHNKKEYIAARHIQRICRGAFDRDYVAQIKWQRARDAALKEWKTNQRQKIEYKKRVHDEKVDHYASTQIQRMVRGFLGKRRWNEEKERQDYEKNFAATRLQFNIRKRIALLALRKTITRKREEAQKELEQKARGWNRVVSYFKRKRVINVNDDVMCRWGGYPMEYPGTIIGINAPGNRMEGETFDVKYTDGFIERRIDERLIRVTKRSKDKKQEESVDPIIAEFSIMAKAKKKRWNHVFKNKKKEKVEESLREEKMKLAILNKQKANIGLRVGINDIKIVIGERENFIMENNQRVNDKRGRPVWQRIDRDLRKNIRMKTNDRVSVYIWYLVEKNVHLYHDIMLDTSLAVDSSRDKGHRDNGYIRFASNECHEDRPSKDHWLRLPMNIYMKRDHQSTPIQEIRVSWPTRGNKMEIDLMDDGFLQLPEDLGMFGMDRGLHLWVRWAEEMEKEKEELEKRVEELNELSKKYAGIAWQDPEKVGKKAGGGWLNERIRTMAKHFGIEEANILKMYEQFKKIDRDRDGKISTTEWFYWLGFDNGIEDFGKFAVAPFALCGLDHESKIDFADHVQVCVSYIMLSKREIMKMCFNHFDDDGSGDLDRDELEEGINDLHKSAPDYRQRHIARSMSDFFKREYAGNPWMLELCIDFPLFRKMNLALPQLLYPVFRLHDCVMRRTLGKKYWEDKKAMWTEQRDIYRKAVFERQDAVEKEEKEMQKKALIALQEAELHKIYKKVVIEKGGDFADVDVDDYDPDVVKRIQARVNKELLAHIRREEAEAKKRETQRREKEIKRLLSQRSLK
eukprot:g4112.t1